MLSLHGHIPESFEESGVWKTKIGRTVCIQPGQSTEELVVVAGNLDDLSFERKLLPVG
jgi:Icc-related predicted phosphoesterase